MLFDTILGHKHLVTHLQVSADQGRVPHAQLFVGPSGVGVLPIAIEYAAKLLSINNLDNQSAVVQRVRQLQHPDLHFVFPVATTTEVKRHPVSDLFLDSWRSFVAEKPYGSLFEWYQHIGIENKQGRIGVDEAQDMVKKLSLKSHQGGYKVMIVWMADKMNTECANKILKLVEEPPADSVLILIAENEEQIIGTIRSRCQKLNFPLLAQEAIASGLQQKFDIDMATAQGLAKRAEGDFNKAVHLHLHDGDNVLFERWFLYWVRTAFKAKGNKMAINDLLAWSEEVAGSGRETQKQFLAFCTEFFRDAMLINYGASEIVYYTPESPDFDLKKFAPFIHEGNIQEIISNISSALYHVERNGNPKIIFSDLAISLTRLIHKKAS
ncbi:ATP-binding protein [Gilvibacter sediminis]|uniref:DNA polymerase III subunit n=1 Tax=Gilvibacter sediminis TaxID=379071 RepID=UPI00235017C0|nr:DNA polymerase III subunit delta' [Gilvibacter sediminis]MDC7996811.1 DNA polymerase III subunit delta' [Gilvibacter sediminis]